MLVLKIHMFCSSGGYRQVPVSRAASRSLSRRPPAPALEALFLARKRAAEAATELKTDDGLPERQGRDWMTRLG